MEKHHHTANQIIKLFESFVLFGLISIFLEYYSIALSTYYEECTLRAKRAIPPQELEFTGSEILVDCNMFLVLYFPTRQVIEGSFSEQGQVVQAMYKKVLLL